MTVHNIQDPPAGPQPHTEFVGIEGLRHIIVGTRVHCLNEILRLRAARQHEDVYVGPVQECGPNAPADFQAVHPRHHPFEHGQARGILGFEDVPGFGAAASDHGLVPPLGQHGFEHGLKDWVVIGNKDSVALGRGAEACHRTVDCTIVQGRRQS